ncbi:hypothetical protein [Winogradskyella rapida]|uniref:Adhesin domain-containing protein n=1 Tax=Winogradskyella rapida TaxID=549701 RepID=A0ABW3KUT6_9FLAO
MTLVIDNKRPFRFVKSGRSLCLTLILFCLSFSLSSQNIWQQQRSAQGIEAVTINGNQIFNIEISTSKTTEIKATSIVDGAYQDDFQVLLKAEDKTLYLSLEKLSLLEIPDDKRNAHKVIAATLKLEIPEELRLNILSDIASVNIDGAYKSLYIELLSGACYVVGTAQSATINTIDGDIVVSTTNSTFDAHSNHGEIKVPHNDKASSLWTLTSINGDITVKQ